MLKTPNSYKSCTSCKKSFGNDTKPIICEQCNAIRCEQCWIVNDDGDNICPRCFSMPKDNRKIVFYALLDNVECNKGAEDAECNECYLCFEQISNYIILGCGHSTCIGCYLQLLNNQTSDEIYSVPVTHHTLLDDDIYDKSYLISVCPMCNTSPDRYIYIYMNNRTKKSVRNIHNIHNNRDHKNKKIIFSRKKSKIHKEHAKEIINEWNMYHIFTYVTKCQLIDIPIAIRAIMQYRLFMMAKVEENDVDASKLSPSPIISKIWYTHILFTNDYKKFCDSLGIQINHNPLHDIDSVITHKTYKRMLDWLFKKGVYIDYVVWPVDKIIDEYAARKEDVNNPDNPDTMGVTIFQYNNKSVIFDITKNTKIWELKALLSSVRNVKISKLRMFYNGKLLNNVYTVDFYNIQHGSIIRVDGVSGVSGCC
jgi:hypothetical protein